MSIIFRQLFSKPSSTYSYLIGCGLTRKAILIDGVLEETARDIQVISELNLDLLYSINTHMHADHVRSCEELKKTYPSLKAVHGDKWGKCDILVQDGDRIECGQNVKLSCLYTPGHTDGCFCYIFDNEHHPMVFTGDTMLIRKCGRTDFQNGNASDLYDSFKEKLYRLPDHTLVFPGHDYVGLTCSSIGEEKLHNARCSEQATREQFVKVMDNLNLNPPNDIEYNVTENRNRG
eukprot:420232_1